MARRKQSAPTGKERMKRNLPPFPQGRPSRFEFDVKKAFSLEQLAEIGAISVAWNQLEDLIDFLMMVSFQTLFSSFKVFSEIMDGIKSRDSKIDILETHALESGILNDTAKKCIGETFYAFKDLRHYRNAVVHCRIFDHEKGIAVFIDPDSKPWQILVTKEALSGLYERLVLLRKELMEIDLLLRMAVVPARITVISDKTGSPEPDQPKALRERAVPDHTQKVLLHQKARKSLPPLPEFPDAHLFRPKREDLETHLHFGEMDQG